MAPTGRSFVIGGLGEIALRCVRFQEMIGFFRDIIGLPVLRENPERGIVFLRISQGYAGHTAVLALFDGGKADGNSARPENGLHHLALSVEHADLPKVAAWYEANDIAYTVEDFEWAGWRGIFTHDPDGNMLEIVAKLPDQTGESSGI